jgi:hypothetical protein
VFSLLDGQYDRPDDVEDSVFNKQASLVCEEIGEFSKGLIQPVQKMVRVRTKNRLF